MVGDLPTIHANEAQIRRLFQNLIGNSLKFHRPGVAPEIVVRGRDVRLDGGGRAHEITVEDNGIGFDPQYLDRIFNLFQVLHGRNEYAGTGIGLAICRKIVETHSGTITARSQLGEGSKFIVTLPIERNPGMA